MLMQLRTKLTKQNMPKNAGNNPRFVLPKIALITPSLRAFPSLTTKGTNLKGSDMSTTLMSITTQLPAIWKVDLGRHGRLYAPRRISGAKEQQTSDAE